MEFETKECAASFWPHGRHPEGPWDVNLGKRTWVDLMKTWSSNRDILFSMDQPEDETNITVLRVVFLKPGTTMPSIVGDDRLHKARLHKSSPSVYRVVVKSRYVRNPRHPIPMGQYKGHIFHNDRAVVITLQAGGTISKKTPVEPKRNIVLPGDEGFNESLRDVAKTIHRTYGMGG